METSEVFVTVVIILIQTLKRLPKLTILFFVYLQNEMFIVVCSSALLYTYDLNWTLISAVLIGMAAGGASPSNVIWSTALHEMFKASLWLPSGKMVKNEDMMKECASSAEMTKGEH